MNKRLEDNKEVGTIVNNKAVFLELKFEADLTTGDVDTKEVIRNERYII